MSGGWLTTLFGLGLLAVPALLVPATLRVRGAAAYVVAGLVTAAATLVLVAEVVSVGDGFGLGYVLVAQVVVAAAAAVAWLRTGRPSLPRPPRIAPQAIWAAVRAEPAVAILAFAALAALAVQLWQGLAVVSTGWDPLAYHLPRAAYWVQHHSITQFPGGTVRQLGYPPDAEIIVAWTMLVAGGDALANVVQWVALIGAGAAIYTGARTLRFARPPSALAALLFVTMPIPIMEAATANNDDVAVFFVTAAAVLGVRGIRDRHWGELTVAAAAIGLALGTKGIVVLTGPTLAILFAVASWRSRMRPRAIAAALGLALGGFALLGAYNFALNLKNTHDLYGHAREGTQPTSSFVTNSIRVDWQYVDLPGIQLPWSASALAQLQPGALDPVAQNGFQFTIDSDPNDSRSAFGPVAPLMLFPILVGLLLWRRTPGDRRVLAGAVLVFLVLFPLSAENSLDQARLAAVGIGLGAPLLALLHRRPGLIGVAVALNVAVLVPCLLWNPYKPVIVPPGGAVPAYKAPRAEQYAYSRPEFTGVVEKVDSIVGKHAALGFAGPGDAWDYPFFGPHLEHRLVRMLDTNSVTLENMRRQGLAGVVLDQFTPPKGLKAVKLGPLHTLVLPQRG